MKGRMMAVLLALTVMAYVSAAQGMEMPGATQEAVGSVMDSMDAQASTEDAGAAHSAMDSQTTLGGGMDSMDAHAKTEAADGAHGAMDMHSMTPVDHLAPSANPMYPVGAQVVIETDHMAGMQGAKGVISGAFDTTLYAVDYIATNGVEVKNHRWVIAEEIENSAGKAFAVGDAVTLGQGHMESLGGAGLRAVVVQVVEGPAYMVDYDPTDGGARVVNHQWVAEFELKNADASG